MDAPSLITLFGYLAVAAIIYALCTYVPPAAQPIGRVAAGIVALLGILIFLLHILQGAGVIH